MSAGDARAGELLDSAYDSLSAQLGRRRVASWRCAPLPTGRRDPLARVADRRTPSDFSLSPAELAHEWRRLTAHGWPASEIGRVLLPPSQVEVAA